MVGNYRKGKNGLYILSKDNIDFEAEEILKKYCNKCLQKPQKVDIEKLIEDMGITLCYAQLTKNSEILGAFVFNSGSVKVFEDGIEKFNNYKEKTIIIEENMVEENDVRLKFTFGHELGHYVTQYNILHIDSRQLSMFDYDIAKKSEVAVVCKREFVNYEVETITHKKLITKEDWQEWQANYFSSCVLIPKVTLQMYLKPYIEKMDILNQQCLLNQMDLITKDKLIDDLCNIYDVTKEMMVNRLKSLNYLK